MFNFVIVSYVKTVWFSNGNSRQVACLIRQVRTRNVVERSDNIHAFLSPQDRYVVCWELRVIHTYTLYWIKMFHLHEAHILIDVFSGRKTEDWRSMVNACVSARACNVADLSLYVNNEHKTYPLMLRLSWYSVLFHVNPFLFLRNWSRRSISVFSVLSSLPISSILRKTTVSQRTDRPQTSWLTPMRYGGAWWVQFASYSRWVLNVIRSKQFQFNSHLALHTVLYLNDKSSKMSSPNYLRSQTFFQSIYYTCFNAKSQSDPKFDKEKCGE